MARMPLISIIVPVFNAENYLSDCITSILAQTLTDFELLLVNDGSTDNSGSICDEFAKNDFRIKVINKKKGGASDARNVGVNEAQGKYIGWVDADDSISHFMYDKLYTLAELYNADITECQFLMKVGDRINRSGVREPIVSGKGDFIMKQFFSASMKAGLTTKLYKRELWDKVRFPLGRKHQDCYVNMLFALMPLTYVRTSEPLYYYIVRRNSITTTLTSHEIRQAIYLYEYTINLAYESKVTGKAKKYLKKDAINRLIGRFFEIAENSEVKNQYVYIYYIRKKLGFSILKYLLLTNLHFKTRISYALLLLNQSKIQKICSRYFGKKGQ